MKLELEAETLIMGDVPLSQACMIELFCWVGHSFHSS